MADAPPARNHHGTPSMFSRQIGERIHVRRRELGWRQGELAERFGVGRDSISRYESGQTEINASDLPRLADILGVHVAYFYGITSAAASTAVVAGRSVDDVGFMNRAWLRDISLGAREKELLSYYGPLADDFKDIVLARARALYELQFGCAVGESKEESGEDDRLAKAG